MVRFTIPLIAGGCIFNGDGDGGGGGGGGSGDEVPEFGSNPSFSVIAKGSDELDVPRDLEFHPDRPEELWVANRATDTIVVVWDSGTSDQTTESFYDAYANHFLEEVSSIAFGADDTWASCQESENTYDDNAAPNWFMGPALWPGDLDIFAQVNQNNSLLGSHLDMLHESPLCMGIEHDKKNAYWVFDGYNDNLVWYDFQEPHILGGDDHSDGIVRRFTEIELDRVPNVPGHLVHDDDTDTLYIANTGQGEILAFDTTTGEVVGELHDAPEPLQEYSEMGGAEFSVFADGFDEPSGLAIAEDRLFVSDHANGDIVALDLSSGEELDRITVPEGKGIMGLEIGPDGLLYYAHGKDDVTGRVDP